MKTKAKQSASTKHPDAIAWDDWLKENAKSADPTTLQAPARMQVYLENRLASAFQAGVAHGRKHPAPNRPRAEE